MTNHLGYLLFFTVFTNQDKNYLIYIICSAVGIVGMGLIIYDRKNKR